jgi:hypothetical protein
VASSTAEPGPAAADDADGDQDGGEEGSEDGGEEGGEGEEEMLSMPEKVPLFWAPAATSPRPVENCRISVRCGNPPSRPGDLSAVKGYGSFRSVLN